MIVVSFKEFTPTPRYDGTPWHHVTIEEAPIADGPWTVIETVNLVVDADPAHPAPRNFTTNSATLEQGWYKITFFDATGNEALPVEPIHNLRDETFPYSPTVEEVAKLIMSRTKDRLGKELGTFTDQTRPKFDAVEDIIEEAASDVTTDLDTDIPEGAWSFVRQLIALRAAMMIERSYFAEQITSNRSPYPQLEKDFELLLARVTLAVKREDEEATTGEQGQAVRPSYSFPEADHRLDYGRPL